MQPLFFVVIKFVRYNTIVWNSQIWVQSLQNHMPWDPQFFCIRCDLLELHSVATLRVSVFLEYRYMEHKTFFIPTLKRVFGVQVHGAQDLFRPNTESSSVSCNLSVYIICLVGTLFMPKHTWKTICVTVMYCNSGGEGGACFLLDSCRLQCRPSFKLTFSQFERWTTFSCSL
jgi:hypothetical protein